mmetsp:Transcript_111309/g.208732  ORF Transcript_111309/g.208732 Transcript_111309/m.208732 type:complete len:223 (-) Transcript_111309:45-713(-)
MAVDTGVNSLMKVLVLLCLSAAAFAEDAPLAPTLMRSARTSADPHSAAVQADASHKIVSRHGDAAHDVKHSPAGKQKHTVTYKDFIVGRQVCGCRQDSCDFHSTGVARKQGFGKTCANAVLIGHPGGILNIDHDTIAKDPWGRHFKLSGLKSCLRAVSKSRDLCSDAFMMDLANKSCTCVPVGETCREVEWPAGCRYHREEDPAPLDFNYDLPEVPSEWPET